MGNISNLATTGNYKTDVNGIEVSFNFEVDNKTAKFRNITGGEAKDKTGFVIATFNKENYGGMDGRDRINYSIQRSYEVEAVTAIVQAIASLEAKINAGEAVNPVVE